MSKTVLVVEDDTLVRQSLVHVLTEKGLQVVEAADGKEGLEKALAGGINLVVTDVRMPEMDGLEMVEKLRADDNGKQLPVIVLTNDEQTATMNQALQAGVTVYLSKASTDAETIADQILTAAG